MTDPLDVSDRYPRHEEVTSSLIHAIGALLSVAALIVLVVLSARIEDVWRLVSFSIYGTCLVLLYLASSFYHGVRLASRKRVLRLFDHAAIFLLIAGTYTPICLISLQGGWRWTLFGLIWGIGLAGITMELLFIDRYEHLTTGLYIGMGWMALIAIKPLFEVLETGALVWMGMGGVFYTGGVVFYKWDKLPFNHAIWHLFVLAGSFCHFVMFLQYVLPADVRGQ